MKVPKTFRFDRELVDKLDAEAVRKGVKASRIVEEAVRRAVRPPSGPNGSKTTVQLLQVLQERTGQPVALCRMFLDAGRVRLDGSRPPDVAPREVFEAGSLTLDDRPV